MHKRMLHLLSCGLLLAGVCAVPVQAQDWDTPSFFSPRPGEDLGVYVMKPQHGSLGYEAIWRQEGNLNLGVRAGVTGVPDFGGKRMFFVGSEFYKPFIMSGSPLLISYMLGAGASFGNSTTLLRIPFGVSIGAQLGSSGMQIMPYVHPRISYDLASFDTGNGTSVSTHSFPFDVDVGADIGLGTQFVAKLGATLTKSASARNSTVFGAGLAYRMPRKIMVR